MTANKIPEVVMESGWYYTDDGQYVQVWRITQDGGCWCSDMKYHCASKLYTAPPSEAVNVIGMPEFDGLLDHIYEYGTAAEGVIERANAFARAVIARYAPQQPAAPSAAAGVEKVKKALERLDRTIEACAKLTQLLGDGQPHSDLISTAGGQAALAKEAIQRVLAQQSAAVDEATRLLRAYRGAPKFSNDHNAIKQTCALEDEIDLFLATKHQEPTT